MVTRHRAATRLLPVCLAASLIAWGPAAPGDDPSAGAVSEYRIKAAYLYYFSTFVEWPPEALSTSGKTLVIGVLGDDPFGAILDETVRGKSAHDSRLVVRRFARATDALESHVLFISASEQDRLPYVLKVLDGANVLTIGDIDRFADLGGQIGFRTEGKKVRFDINVAAAERARLKISAQLLKLGRIVETAARAGG
jgi:hypothetical protein